MPALRVQIPQVVIDGGFYVLGGDADDQVQTRIDRADALGGSLDDYPDTNALRSRVDEFISLNELDDRAREKLESLGVADQVKLMDDDFLIHKKVDPSKGTVSSLFMGKLKKYTSRSW